MLLSRFTNSEYSRVIRWRLTLLGLCGRVECVRTTEFIDAGSYPDQAVLEMLGLTDLTDLPRSDELTIALQPPKPLEPEDDDAEASVPAES